MSKKGTFININYNTNTVIKMTFKEIPKEIQTPVLQPIVLDSHSNGALATLTAASSAFKPSEFASGPLGASTAYLASSNAQNYVKGSVAQMFEKLVNSIL